jgi:hypothetical protein
MDNSSHLVLSPPLKKSLKQLRLNWRHLEINQLNIKN